MIEHIDLRDELEGLRDYYFCEHCFLRGKGECDESFWSGSCYYDYLRTNSNIDERINQLQKELQVFHNEIAREENKYSDYIRDLKLEAELMNAPSSY